MTLMNIIGGNFRKFQEIGKMSPRVRYHYVPSSWEELRTNGLSQEETARAMNVSPRHLNDILNGTTMTCRYKTHKKMIAGLATLKVESALIEKLFSLK